MPNITLATTTAWYSVYTLSSIAVGTSVLITNRGTTTAYLKQVDGVPADTTTEYGLKPSETVMVQGHEDQDIFVRGTNGALVVQSLVSTIAPFTFVDLPHYLYTSSLERYRRLRVDVAQTSFFEGREGRTFLELNIASGVTQVIKVVTPIDVILHDLTLTIDEGSLRVSTIVGGTEGGSFATPLPVIPKNTAAERPTTYYTLQTTLSTGGTLTGGTVIDIVRVVAATATAQRSSVGGSIASERGVAANTYYFKLENIGSSSVTGVFSGWWEERPMPHF